MKILSRILPALNLLCIRFTDGGAEVSLVAYTFRKGKAEHGEAKPIADPVAEKKALSKVPLVAVVSGKGVITKEAAGGNIAATVTSDPETFLWSVSEGKISFVRREQVAVMTDGLEKAGIRPLYTECLPEADETALASVAERFRSEYLKWRRVLKPSAEGSALASFIAERLMLPVLGVLLLVLVANFALSARVNGDFQEANAELAALRKTSSAASVAGDRRRAALEGFSRGLPFRASRLSDRIAAAVPEKITLTELAIAPLSRAPEKGKPVQQSESTVVIRGETSVSEAITEFTTALGRLRLGTIRLAAVEQDTERGILTFRIEITL